MYDGWRMREDILLVAHSSGIEAVDLAFASRLDFLREKGVCLAFIRDGCLDMAEVLPICSHRLKVLPLTLSSGYIVQTIIPREIERLLEGQAVQWELMPPLGASSELADLVMSQLEALTPFPQKIVVLAHTAKQSPPEPLAFYEQLKTSLLGKSELLFAHLDEELLALAPILNGHDCVIQPFFLLRGNHLQRDLPNLLTSSGLNQMRVLSPLGEIYGLVALIQRLIGR